MADRTEYWREYHLRNRVKRLARMAAHYTPRIRVKQPRKSREAVLLVERAYRQRWRHELKLCKHLDITMAQARKMTGKTL